jgi:hypothetical protein
LVPELEKSPRVEKRVGEQKLAVEAEELTTPDRDCLWATVPDYWKECEKRSGDLLPLVRLRRTK